MIITTHIHLHTHMTIHSYKKKNNLQVAHIHDLQNTKKNATHSWKKHLRVQKPF